jgi:glycosyltransferase involved in cell wall biosynthesis
MEVKRLLFSVSEDWYFVSHRLHLAEAAKRAGYHVGVLTRVSKDRRRIEEAGIDVIDWNLDRRSRSAVKEFKALRELFATLREFKPDLIHAVALKPVLYSSFASRFVGPDARVFALGGLGFVFASSRPLARLLRPLVVSAFRLALGGARTRLVLQNPDDRDLLTFAGAIHLSRVRMIRGAGVDTNAFRPQPEMSGDPLVVLPARMLWDKGVAEFVAAAIKLRERGVAARFALVGEPDEHNPECVPDTQLRKWNELGLIEWWGRRDDMPEVFARAHIVCLPTSYGEGLPKALLEAASCARPIVTYDVPGCREIVEDRLNGILVPVKDKQKLVEAIAQLLIDPDLRRKMGAAGRAKVVKGFSQESVAEETLRVWEEVLV